MRPSVALVRRVARVEAVGRQRPIRRRSRFGPKPRFEAATCSLGVFGGPVGGHGCQWRGMAGRWPLVGAAMAARRAGVSISAPPPRAPQATRGEPRSTTHREVRSMTNGGRFILSDVEFYAFLTSPLQADSTDALKGGVRPTTISRPYVESILENAPSSSSHT